MYDEVNEGLLMMTLCLSMYIDNSRFVNVRNAVCRVGIRVNLAKSYKFVSRCSFIRSKLLKLFKTCEAT